MRHIAELVYWVASVNLVLCTPYTATMDIYTPKKAAPSPAALGQSPILRSISALELRTPKVRRCRLNTSG